METDIKKLRQLVTVARTGNFSRAAEELHITQPALSRSIAGFEEHFGIRIFDRGRNGAVLTPLGAMVIAEAETLIKQAHALDHNLRLYAQGDAGKINFGMGPLVASMVLPSLSIHFLHSRPKLRLQASVKSVRTLLIELMDDTIEMLFCAGEQIEATNELALEKVGSAGFDFFVRAGHPLAGCGPLSRSGFGEFPILCGSEFSTFAGSEGAFLCDNYHILRDTALHTDGIWISSPLFVKEELNSGQLVALTVTDHQLPQHSDIIAVRRSGYTPSPAADAIYDFVRRFYAGLAL